MDEPSEMRDIQSFIEESFAGEDSDTSCKIRTVVPTRTFLEKIFLLAEEFQKNRPRSVRMSRHLYDIEKLMDTEYGIAALSDRSLYKSIIEHRKAYYGLKYVDYDLLAPESINFNIPEPLIKEWENDYNAMRHSFIYGKSLDFELLSKRIKELQGRIKSM